MIYQEEPPDFKSRFEIVSCFMENNGEILLLHRQDHKPQGDTWGVVAGKMDAGETTGQAILRELREESGHVTDPAKLEYFRKVYVRSPEYDLIYHMYHLPVSPRPDIKTSISEHKGFRWITPTRALQENLIHDLGACIKLFYNI